MKSSPRYRKLDFIYLTPAILCFVAFIAGMVPCLTCVHSPWFAYASLVIFIVSIAAHIVILWLWRRYKDYSPLAYALTQPMAHAIILVISLSVGSVDVCTVPESQRDRAIIEADNVFTGPEHIADWIK